MKLRFYQGESIDHIQEFFRLGYKRIVLAIPTGGGKTIVFSEIAWKAYMKGKRVMILTHRKELLKQASKFNNNGCEICMVETLYNRMKAGKVNINDYDLIIIDEAHIGSFKKILADYKNFVIGATATPLTKPSMSTIYQEIVCNVDIPSLIEQKYLSVPRTFLKTNVDVSKLESKSGEYTEKSLDGLYNKPKVYSGMVDDYVREGRNRKAICFCANIEHTINVHAEFKSRGVNAFLIHSKQTEYERDRQVELFAESIDGVLVNANIATTGFDQPDITLVMVGKATRSLNLWLQMCGRGGRIIDGVKYEFAIWDYGDNVVRLGFWESERDWRKIFFTPDKKRKGEQPAPVKSCPSCQAITYASARICPFCKFEFDIKTIPLTEGQLVEMAYKPLEGKKLYDLSYDELFELARLKKYKQFFIESVLYHNPAHAGKLEQFWNMKDYKQGYRERRLESMAEQSPPKNFFVKK